MSDHSKRQAELKLEDIVRFAAALDLDWNRLQELRDAFDDEGFTQDGSVPDDKARADWAAEYPEESDELEELEAIAEGFEDEDDVRQQLDEYALDISVRSEWQGLGESLEPSEYRILLCTGGPAVQITGDLGRWNSPETAQIEHQDWFESWKGLPTDTDQEAALLRIAEYLMPEC